MNHPKIHVKKNFPRKIKQNGKWKMKKIKSFPKTSVIKLSVPTNTGIWEHQWVVHILSMLHNECEKPSFVCHNKN